MGGGGGKRSLHEESGDDQSAEINKLRMEMNRLREETQNSLKGM
jgi:hypothetical protein